MADEFDPDQFLADAGIDDNGSDLVKNLRKLVKQLGKERDEARAQIAEFQTQQKQTQVKQTWDSLGVPEAIRGFYKGDDDAEAIKSWWEASKGFFNIPDPEGDKSGGTPPAPPADPEQQNGLQQVAQAASLGQDQPASLTQDAIMQAAQQVKNTSASKNPDALAQFLTQLGVPGGGITPPRVG